MITATHVLSIKESDFLPKSFSAAKAKNAFRELETWTFSKEALELTAHEVEREIEKRGREVQRLMLQAHFEARGTGEKGPFLEAVKGEPGGDPALLSHRRMHRRTLVSIFGEVKLCRMGYGKRGEESLHPLDEELELPKRSFSYELTRRLMKKSVQGPFDEAIDGIREMSGVEVPKRSSEQLLPDSALDFDAFYHNRAPPEAESTGPIVVASVDSKGIPMVKKGKAKRVARRTKGERANKNRLATVATVFTQKPRIRKEVVESLFKDSEEQEEDFVRAPRNPPEYKRVWASLKKGKEEVLKEVAEEMERRDPQGTKKRAVVTDGERALQKRVRSLLKAVILILDLLHVMERLWKAAHALYPEGSKEAEEWTRKQALRILRGEVSQAVKGMRRSATTRELSSIKRKGIRDTASYLYRNRSFMRYHEYLREGLPIASGAVEGACKNLIKDRMERSGMRWTEPMAEAMLKMRAIYVSGDFDMYWDYHIHREQNRLYSRRWKVPKIVVEK